MVNSDTLFASLLQLVTHISFIQPEMASLAHVNGVIALWELDAEARPWSFSWCEHGWVNQADWVETGTLTFFLYLKEHLNFLICV